MDELNNVADLAAAAMRHGTRIECLVEIDCGAGRRGVSDTSEILSIAAAINTAPCLRFAGLQAYQGALQHIEWYEGRRKTMSIAIPMVHDAVEALSAIGLDCDIVASGGTGSYYFESGSGVYSELQCGSYAFMDADYGRIRDVAGHRIDPTEWENALFILTSVISHSKPDRAICDAGLKTLPMDSGLPFVFGRDHVRYVECSDEHGVIVDPQSALAVNDKTPLAISMTGMSACATIGSRPFGRCQRGGGLLTWGDGGSGGSRIFRYSAAGGQGRAQDACTKWHSTLPGGL